MDPEQRLLVVQKYFAVKFLVILIGALVWMFRPERMDVA